MSIQSTTSKIEVSDYMTGPGKYVAVYHRTQKVENIKAIFTIGYRIGPRGLYGEGLYGCYDIKSQFSQYMKQYGDYIVKFYVNSSTFLNFDKLKQQSEEKQKSIITSILNAGGIRPTTDLELRNLSIVNANKASEIVQLLKSPFSSIAAKRFSESIDIRRLTSKGINGVMFNGQNDGRVLIAYNPTAAVPISYTQAPVVSMGTKSSAEIANSLSWHSMDYKPRLQQKHAQNTLGSFLNRKLVEKVAVKNRYTLVKVSKPGNAKIFGITDALLKFSPNYDTNIYLLYTNDNNRIPVCFLVLNYKLGVFVLGQYTDSLLSVPGHDTIKLFSLAKFYTQQIIASSSQQEMLENPIFNAIPVPFECPVKSLFLVTKNAYVENIASYYKTTYFKVLKSLLVSYRQNANIVLQLVTSKAKDIIEKTKDNPITSIIVEACYVKKYNTYQILSTNYYTDAEKKTFIKADSEAAIMHTLSKLSNGGLVANLNIPYVSVLNFVNSLIVINDKSFLTYNFLGKPIFFKEEIEVMTKELVNTLMRIRMKHYAAQYGW